MAAQSISSLFGTNPIAAANVPACLFEIAGDFGAGYVSGAIEFTELQSAILEPLGTAALQDSTAFATAAQGAKADSALQDGSAFATAAQGAKADTALQLGDEGTLTVDSGWGANADDGNKATSLPSDGTASAIFTSEGLGMDTSNFLISLSSEVRALRAALRDGKRPNN